MIFAIDFDGTIFSEAWPEIGEPVREVVKFIRELQERGDLWILYTMREGATLEQAVAALAELGLRPDAINDNLPERRLAISVWRSSLISCIFFMICIRTSGPMRASSISGPGRK